MTYQYPATVYDQPTALLAALGGWWANDYHGRDQVGAIVRGKAQIENQTMLDVMELIASLSRYSVPIYHKDNWYALYLCESQRNDADTSLLRYDNGAVYNDGHLYDVPRDRPDHAFPRPADMVDAPIMFNRFTDPTLTWESGVDYVFRDDAVIFLVNPFDDVRIAKRPVYEDGIVVDQEAIIWVFRGDFDWDTIYRQFGYAVGVRLQSSAGYRQLLNAVYDAMVGGTARQQILSAFSAMTGVPLVLETQETVAAIDVDRNHRLIITDQHVYKFVLSATPTVVVGDVVHRGQSLTDTLTIHEFNRGETPETLLALAMGKGFLSSCFCSDLVFENLDVPLNVITDDPSGFTKLTWPLGGFPLDVEHFFDELHTRGVRAAAQPIDECEEVETVLYPADDCDEVEERVRLGTLAHLLDHRPVKVGEPTAAHLPATINPLQFLVENVLRNNAYLVRVKAATTGQDKLGLYNARLLAKIVPPNTAMILLVEITAQSDSVTVDQIQEQVTFFDGVEPISDTVDTVNDERVTLRVISGTCH